MAILADSVSSTEAILRRHVGGVNVLYGHGGAHWVDRKTIAVPLSQLNANFSSNVVGHNLATDQIWSIFDRN